MKFRKKPITIEAWRWTGDMATLPSWAAGVSWDRTGSNSLFIDTLEGVHEARVGDWLIQGIKGEVYPCKPDIFDATYETVP